MNPSTLSVNGLARPLFETLVRDADRLRVHVERDPRGVTFVDAGIAAAGSTAAGMLIARLCMGGLGEAALLAGPREGWPTWLHVHSSQPVLACLASQYAGWSLNATKEETGARKFSALGSGPARALAHKEVLYEELGYRDGGDFGALVLEVDRVPPPLIVDKLLRDCGLAPEGLGLVMTPTASLAGTAQVVARVLEVALHRAHDLGFAVGDIVEGNACAPLPSPGADGLDAMARTNDAILYGGQVHLTVAGDADAAHDLAMKLPSGNSGDHGRSFGDLFAAAGHDFYKLDGALFAPAEVWVSHIRSGKTWHAGGMRMDLLTGLWLAR